MNIYLISQNENNDYDTYDSAVVIAPNEEYAKDMHPSDGSLIDWKNVKVTLIGTSNIDEAKVVCASFNAG